MRRLVLALLLAFAAAPVAHAEVVATGAADAALAVAPDGTPNVAYVADGSIRLARRDARGVWAPASQKLLNPGAAVVGVAASASSTSVLVEDDSGRWLALYLGRGQSLALKLLVSAARGTHLGVAGLALDRRGQPAVAYAYRLASRKTFLRLVRCAARCRGAQVTRGGFPASDVAPSVAPVLMPNGQIRVVEAYVDRTTAAIEWAPLRRDWLGQFVYSSALGVPVGVLRARVAGGAVLSAWTQIYPGLGESHVLLTRHFLGRHDPQEESAPVLRHAALVDLAATPDGVEIGANDWATIGEDVVEAGTLAFADAAPVEFDGTLLGYAAAPGGVRDVLLEEDGVLSWYSTTGRPRVRVSLSAAPDSTGVALSGAVSGANGGGVDLYREHPRRLVAHVPLAADGTFSARDAAPGAPTLYRAVYVEPASGLPYGALLRDAVG